MGKKYKNYSKLACSIHHKRGDGYERGRNRANCPTKIPCKSASVCGDIDKHPNENDMLREARRTKECLEKQFKEAENELSINTRITFVFSNETKRKAAFRVPKSLRGEKFQSFEHGYRSAPAALQEKKFLVFHRSLISSRP